MSIVAVQITIDIHNQLYHQQQQTDDEVGEGLQYEQPSCQHEINRMSHQNHLIG